MKQTSKNGTALAGGSAPADTRTVYLIRRAERSARARLDAIVRKHGLTTPQYTALSVLRMRSGLSSAQLARRAFVSAQAMNEIIIRLEADGLIHRYPTVDHRKTLHCEMTARGNKIFDACDRDCAVVEETLTRGMTETQIAQVRALLARGIESLSDDNARHARPTAVQST